MQVSTLLLLSAVVTVSTAYTFCDPPPGGSNYPNKFAYNPYSAPNHMYLGGMFNARTSKNVYGECGDYVGHEVQNMEAFFWAIRTAKSRYPNQLLPQIDVAGFAWDFCENNYNGLRFTTTFSVCQSAFGNLPIQPKYTLGFVDALFSSQNLEVVKYLGYMTNTVVSAAATSTALSPSNSDYKYFLRTVPSDDKQSEVLLTIIKKLGWNYIQIVHEADTYGTTGAMAVKKFATKNNVCVVQTVSFPSDLSSDDKMEEVVEKLLEKRETRGVVVFANPTGVSSFLRAVKRKNAKNVFTWFATEGWGTSGDAVRGVEEEAQGAVTLSVATPLHAQQFTNDFFRWYKTLKPEHNTWNPSFQEYWMQRFQCKLSGITSKYTKPCNNTVNSLVSETLSQYAGSTILAVDAMLHGIDTTIRNECGTNLGYVCTNLVNSGNHRDIIYNKIRESSGYINGNRVKYFENATGETSVTRMKIYNYRRASGNHPTSYYEEIGYYNNGNVDDTLPGRVYVYQEKNKVATPRSICKAVCYACHYIFPVPTTTEAPPTTVTPETTTPEVTTTSSYPVRPKGSLRRIYVTSTETGDFDIWAIVLLVLAGLGIIVALFFEFYILSKLIGTPLAQFRTMWLGQVLLIGVVLCYLVCIAYAFEPTAATCGITRFGTGVSYALCFSVLVVKGIIILSSKTEGYLRGVYQLLLLIFAWLVQIVIDGEWLILRAPMVYYSPTRNVFLCNHTFEEHVISLVYVMFLILVGTLIAVRTHGIITNHREGIFVGIAAGFSIPLWLAWTLSGALHWNKDFEDPVLAYGLFLNATLILFALFLPKVRQLNIMGVEGVYLEDDVPDDVYGGSVMIAPPSYKSKHDSIYINGGAPGVYSDIPAGMYVADPKSLYLKHPGSVRSAPPVRASRMTTYSQPGRVLTVTNDLTGRPVSTRSGKAHSEIGGYKETSRPSSRVGGMKKTSSASDLGAL